MRNVVFSSVLVLLAVAGCKPRVPTYHRDVAPILAAHCDECHRPGGVAPIPLLDSYEAAKRYQQSIRIATQTRSMPPWGADNTGLCGTWQHARWLTTEEIATIGTWIGSGMPEGEARADAPVVPSVEPFRKDATLDIGGVYHPRIGPSGNHCFVADPALTGDALLTAIRVVSTDARAVAQVTLFALDSDAADAEATALDAADPSLGYACYSAARERDSRLVASWTWPQPISRMPADTGVKLHAKHKMVVQVHYNISQTGDAYEARTTVELELSQTAHEARVVPIAATGTLAPNERYVAVEAEHVIEHAGTIVGIAPRMHIRGKTMQLNVERAGQAASLCLATFDHWHAMNQQLFRFVDERPFVLQANDRVRLQCAFNTQGRSKPVVFGEDADEEECVAYAFVVDR